MVDKSPMDYNYSHSDQSKDDTSLLYYGSQNS